MASGAAAPSLVLLPPVSDSKLSRFGPVRSFPRNVWRSRACAGVAVGSRASAADSLFLDYKPTQAFLFPGQVNHIDFFASFSIDSLRFLGVYVFSMR